MKMQRGYMNWLVGRDERFEATIYIYCIYLSGETRRKNLMKKRQKPIRYEMKIDESRGEEGSPTPLIRVNKRMCNIVGEKKRWRA